MSKLSKDLGVLVGGSLGLSTFWLFSSPKSSMTSKVPSLEVKNVEILPNLKISGKNKVYHIHHWLYLSFFYVSLMLIKRPMKGRRFISGFVLGGIIQGLTYKDRLSFRQPRVISGKN